jgi:phytoene dehydrogenase-like protein
MLADQIRKDMKLSERGLKLVVPDPQLVVPFPDGTAISLHRDFTSTQSSIAKICAEDAKNYQQFDRDLALASNALQPLLLNPYATRAQYANALHALKPGFEKLFFLGSLAETLSCYFKHEKTKAAFAATTSLYPASLKQDGTAFCLPYLAQSEVDNAPGWGVVIGGMGEVTKKMTEACTEAGIKIHTSTPVQKILVENGHVTGLELVNGKREQADLIISNADPYTTIVKLLDRNCFPAAQYKTIAERPFDGACSKANFLLSSELDYKLLGAEIAKAARQTLTVISPSLTYLENAYKDFADGAIPQAPYLELTCLSAIDPSASCGQHHPLSAFVLFTPYSPVSDSWDNLREALLERIIGTIENYSPGFRSTIEHAELFVPTDIEHDFRMHEGNVDHGYMTLNNLFEDRPLCGITGPAMPIAGLYLCGAGTHPGGLVSGMPGYNAAQAIIADLKPNSER